ncbi:hypothetical protein GQ41_3638 [Arenibacter algicola]|uniref:WYL domain-containing protein n=1 Tax=Arenibacter algicola TaxID=616991 RepID=A0ABY3AEV9_9FLAO
MHPDQKTNLSKIIEDQVLSDDIHSLLKSYKEDNKEDIKLSGNKSDIIENLLNAVDKGIIPLIKVYELIRDSEEYGDQYIYVFDSINNTAKHSYSDGESISRKIIPRGEKSQFPKLLQIPSKLEWVDFRAPNRGVENSWLAKMYGKKTREVKIDENKSYAQGLRTVTYRTEESRLIYIVYWDGKRFLEFKISRTSFDSNKSLELSIKEIRQFIGKGVDLHNDFKYFDLTPTVNNILNNSSDNKKIYNLRSTNLIDAQNGTATLTTYGEDVPGLLADLSRKEAIDAYIAKGGSATGIVVTFLEEGSNGILSKDVNVILGRDSVNQIIIPANISPQEYNYVRRKIADFS